MQSEGPSKGVGMTDKCQWMLTYIDVGKNEWRYECLGCGNEAVIYSGHVMPLDCEGKKEKQKEKE